MKKEKTLGYRIARTLLGPIYKICYHPKVVGAEKIPKEGAILLCGNHRHVFDQLPVLISTRRTVHYMAKKEYFDGKNAWFFKMVGCIPVDRSIHDESAKSRALNVLKEGGAIGIFPEGTRNKTIGTKDEVLLLPFKFGAVSMAKKTDATIVPFGLMGDHTIKNKNLTLVFGEPFKVGEMTLEEANKKLEEIIRELAIRASKGSGKHIIHFYHFPLKL